MKKHNLRAGLSLPLIATLTLILLTGAASLILASNINKKEEEAAFLRLYEEADGLTEEIESRMMSDRETLEILATLAEECPVITENELWDILDLFPSEAGFFTRFEILLPGDIVLGRNRQKTDVSGMLSFSEEAARGIHITDRVTDVTGDGESLVVRHYYPIRYNGETVAMIYGVIDLLSLPKEIPGTPYGNNAAMYIIDGKTGDFLMDTWHDELGNIWGLGERPLADGYEHETLRQGLIDGEAAYVVFESATTGTYLYFYYYPMEINDWRLALSIPEDVVFSDAVSIRGILNTFLGFELLTTLIYVVVIAVYMRKRVHELRSYGENDALTGLYNRNKYEGGLLSLSKLSCDSLGCIYIDANDLHRLNNSQGHEAGDKMLKELASVIVKVFGRSHSYRIGGDEFVVFAFDTDKTEIEDKISTLRQILKDRDISVSVGMSYTGSKTGSISEGSSDGSIDINILIKEAEAAMYSDKQKFYSDRKRDRRRG